MPKGYSQRNQGGWRHSDKSKEKMSKNRTGLTAGDKNPRWMGDKVSYPALHRWMRKTLGQPDTCEQCGRLGLSGNKIEWANKSGQYKRDPADWLRLCKKCHCAYDETSKKRWAGHKFFYKSCLACGMSIKTYPCLAKRKKYCSRRCMFGHYKKKV